ncbi:MAG TPA: thioredoxin domain-containing protein, partial [Gammaproteobacteria bacterium]|nr:thioredoxin domain-containing protein [Gammaproteobacteria bacterium]
ACHWCHVMAHESFEDQETAEYLNKHFICIKVDREERPDIDNLYMRALMMFSGQGGWPLNLFLDLDGKPFFGGTYFPKQPVYGLPTFQNTLSEIVRIWESHQEEVKQTAQHLQRRLNQKLLADPAKLLPDFHSIIERITLLEEYVDPQQGGLLGAPKFPQIPLWSLLFMHSNLAKNDNLVKYCHLTAHKLCKGGIYDHVGGGFFRYSTDAFWFAPHFEKMLYDNALILEWLSLLYAHKPDPIYHRAVAQTIQWLEKEMYIDGAFAASLDADSEGKEGKYYTWTWEELSLCLGEDLALIRSFFGAREEGNWHGTNILHQNHEDEHSVTFNEEIEKILNKLLEVRKIRIRPERDEKILLSWNALLIVALCKASLFFNERSWLNLAISTYQTLLDKLRHKSGWYHCYRANLIQKKAQIEDYAGIISAAIHLYQVTGNKNYLENAEQWYKETQTAFLDVNNNLYNQNSESELIAQLQPLDDTAIPSGNGLMAINTIALGLLTGNPQYYENWTHHMQTVLSHIEKQNPALYPCHFQSLLLYYRAIKLESSWTRKFPKFVETLGGNIPSHWLFVNGIEYETIHCCDHKSCFAELTDVQDLRIKMHGR